MKTTRNIFILLGAVVALAVIYLIFFSEPTVSWNESYQDNTSQPYGSQVMRELIEKSFDSQTFEVIQDSIHLRIDLDTVPENSNYFFIGKNMYLDSLELDFMLNWVKEGNNAFLFSYGFHPLLVDTLLTFSTDYSFSSFLEEDFIFEEEGINTVLTDTISLDLFANEQVLDSSFECVLLRHHSPQKKAWWYFPDEMQTSEGKDVLALGEFNESYLNYITFPYGEGKFYLHSTPIAFTNYYLQEKQGFDHLNKVLSHAGDGHNYWDGYNREFQWTPNFDSGTGTHYQHSESPLAFILSEKALRVAWGMLLALGALYLIFGARRKQRSIPVIHPPENTSLEYAETIGKMFRLENNHQHLIRLKMKLFLSWVRERYHLRTQTETKEEETTLIEKLAVKSDITEEQVADLFQYYHAIEDREDKEGKNLIQFHRKLESFYNNAR